MLEADDAAFVNKSNFAAEDRIGSQDDNVVESPDREKCVFVLLTGPVDFIQFPANHLCLFEPHLRGKIVHFRDQPPPDVLVSTFNESNRLVYVFQIRAPVDVVIAGTRAGMHLEVQAIRMRIVAPDVIQARAELERAFKSRFQACELTAGKEWPEIVHAWFYFPARVNARKALPPVDLHQRKQPERAHLAICLWKVVLSFAIKDVNRFESRIRLDELDAARDFAQVQIANTLRPLAVVACESFEKVTRLIENDQFSANVEDFINA